MELDNVARQLSGIKLKNDSYLCMCPNHKDEKPTLTLTVNAKGHLLWHCKGGCDPVSLTEAMQPFLKVDLEAAERRLQALKKEVKEIQENPPRSEPPKRIFEELDSLIEYNRKFSIPFGIPLFDDALGKINPTDLILLAGPSGEGKTQLATHFTNQACLEGRRVTFFSLESFHREIESRIFYGILADKFFSDPHRKSYIPMYYRLWIQGNPETVEALKKYRREAELEYERRYGDRLRMVYRDTSHFSVKEFERFFATYSRDSDLIVVDHLNYFDSHDDSKSENKVTEEIMKRIRDCVLIAKKPVLLLTHVRKKDGREKKLLPDMEDIHGSSNIYKIATKSIILGVDYSQWTTGESSTLIKITKDRYSEGLGRYAFRVGFNLRTRSYMDRYEIGRIAKGEKGSGEFFEPLEPSKVPGWVRGERKEIEEQL